MKYKKYRTSTPQTWQLGTIAFFLSFIVGLLLLTAFSVEMALHIVRVSLIAFLCFCLICQFFQNAPKKYFIYSLIYLFTFILSFLHLYYFVIGRLWVWQPQGDPGRVFTTLAFSVFFIPSSLYQCIPSFRSYLDAKYPPPDIERPLLTYSEDEPYGFARVDLQDKDKIFYVAALIVGGIFTALMGVITFYLFHLGAFGAASGMFLFFAVGCYFIKRTIDNHRDECE